MSFNPEKKRERSNSGGERQSSQTKSSRTESPPFISDEDRQEMAAGFRRNYAPPGGWPAGMRVVESNGRMLSDSFECPICGDPDVVSNPRELSASGGHVRFPCNHRFCWPHAAQYQTKLYRDNPNSGLVCALCRNPGVANQLQYENHARVAGGVPHAAPLQPNFTPIQLIDQLVAAQPTRLVEDNIVPQGRGTFTYTDPLTRRTITWPDFEWEDCIIGDRHAPTAAQVWFMCGSGIPHRVTAETFDEMYPFYRRTGRFVNILDPNRDVNQCFFCRRMPCFTIRVPEGAAQYIPPPA